MQELQNITHFDFLRNIRKNVVIIIFTILIKEFN